VLKKHLVSGNAGIARFNLSNLDPDYAPKVQTRRPPAIHRRHPSRPPSASEARPPPTTPCRSPAGLAWNPLNHWLLTGYSLGGHPPSDHAITESVHSSSTSKTRRGEAVRAALLHSLFPATVTRPLRWL
jgi:hypothetical protein